MSVCFIEHRKIFCASNQQTEGSKFLAMPHQLGICRIRPYKMTKIILTETSREKSFPP